MSGSNLSYLNLRNLRNPLEISFGLNKHLLHTADIVHIVILLLMPSAHLFGSCNKFSGYTSSFIIV